MAGGATERDMVGRSPRAEGKLRPLANGSIGRIVSLDLIRGIAVMGILAANIIGFGQPFLAYMWPDGFVAPHGGADEWMWIAQFVLVDGKFRGLFSLLFGAGMVLFMDRAWARGETRWLQARRLFWLFLFGLAHFYLLWRGDILTLYAICGLVALACIRWRAEVQLAVGLIGYMFGAAFNSIMLGNMWIAEGGVDGAGGQTSAAGEIASMVSQLRSDATSEVALAQHGTYFGYVAHGFLHHGTEWLDGVVMFYPETIPLMFIGMGLYRVGIFDGQADRDEQARWGWIGVIVGSLATLVLALWIRSNGLSYAATLFAFDGPMAFTRLPVVIGAAALLALWAPAASGWLGQRVVATGRMAFSNYIGTSLVMLFVFQPPGLRLFGQLTRTELYLVAFAGCCLMLAWSQPWLARFGYGPLEWLWRCLTYRLVIPMRRSPHQSLA